MRIIERQPNDFDQVTQWLAGCVGAMITTLPCFIVMPFWLIFVLNYKVVDSETGKDDDFMCGVICFLAGMFVWGVAIGYGVIQ